MKISAVKRSEIVKAGIPNAQIDRCLDTWNKMQRRAIPRLCLPGRAPKPRAQATEPLLGNTATFVILDDIENGAPAP